MGKRKEEEEEVRRRLSTKGKQEYVLFSDKNVNFSFVLLFHSS